MFKNYLKIVTTFAKPETWYSESHYTLEASSQICYGVACSIMLIFEVEVSRFADPLHKLCDAFRHPERVKGNSTWCVVNFVNSIEAKHVVHETSRAVVEGKPKEYDQPGINLSNCICACWN